MDSCKSPKNEESMLRPLVTIGMPCYNSSRFLPLAIQSVLNQTYDNFELIVTDDGSTDNSVEIATSFKDSRIKVISDGKNKGISYRLNQQIDLAKGEFFVRMDSDDIMLPTRVKDQLDYLLQHPTLDLISGNAYVIDDENNIIGLREIVTSDLDMGYEEWYNGKFPIHPTCFGRTEYFRKYHYSDKLNGVEDQCLWFTSSMESKIRLLPDVVLFYRDPLKFKRNTYIFRQRQYIKMWEGKECQTVFGRSKCLSKIRGCRLRQFLAVVISSLCLDPIMISRRNRPLNEQDESYQRARNLLQHIIMQNNAESRL